MTSNEFEAYLSPDALIDSDHEQVIAYAMKAVGGSLSPDPFENAVRLYYAVRDDVLYDPYCVSLDYGDYRASGTLAKGRGFCVQKAALLCAVGRVCRVPSRVGFATVKNHLASKQLIEFVGSNLFVFHGYTEFFLNDKWVKATPAFNGTLCQKHRVAPLEFNGHEDSIFQPYNADEKLFMEYTEYYGTFSTVPVDTMINTWREVYGDQRVKSWFDVDKESGGPPKRDFYKEEPV